MPDRDNDGLPDIDEIGITREIPARPPNCSANSFVEIEIPGYQVQVGEKLTLSATGTINGGGLLNNIGPAGTSRKIPGRLTLPNAPLLAVIARIGSNPYFLVGSATTFEATWAGTVTFAINESLADFEFCNNSGSFWGTVGRNLRTDPDNPDTDGDGCLDGEDDLPLDPEECLDTDGDGIGNRRDPDDDGDGLADLEEIGFHWELPAGGDPTVEYRTGLMASRDIPFPLSATGEVHTTIPDVTSGPAGNVTVDVASSNVMTRDARFLALVARIGQSDYFSIGEKGSIVFPASATILKGTKHLGDGQRPTWQVKSPEGISWTAQFTLAARPTSDARLECQVWDTYFNNKVLINGQELGMLATTGALNFNYFIPSTTVLPRSFFRQGVNTITIACNAETQERDNNQVVTDYDDFMISNAVLHFTSSRYKMLLTGRRHLGDNTVEGWPLAVGEEANFEFSLTEVPPGPAKIHLHLNSVNNPNPFLINGTQVGTLPVSVGSGGDIVRALRPATLTIPAGHLHVGYNTLTLRTTQISRGDLDDYLAQWIALELSEDLPPELVLAVNDVRGGFDDNSGVYDVRIGSGTPSNPLLKDTDGDGLDDKTEIEFKLNPNDPSDADADFDGDGLSTRQEIKHKTDMFKSDTDGDKIGDGEEVRVGSDPLNKLRPIAFDANADNRVNSLDLLVFSRKWIHSVTPESIYQVFDVSREATIMDATHALILREKLAK